MVEPLCKEYGVEVIDVLTGFKNICALPNEWDNTGEKIMLWDMKKVSDIM